MSPKLSRATTVVATLALAAIALLATLTGAAHGTSRGAERITLRGVTVHGVDKPIRVTATGPINGHGTAKDDDNPNGKGVLILYLQNGEVSITNKTTSLEAKLNARRCTATITERGTFEIVGGTGQYKRATGNGTYTNRRKLIGARTPNGSCAGRSAPPQAAYDNVVLTGEAAR
ncbi:MAG: hypothetical protein JO342_16725 [Solirubrobacterales bacterium]|nr:hypothetical protein [Solirubrobacterales bacterium]MBV9167783.1 hypothetical protein [Solirubrobacterales bacterium]